MKPVNNDFYEKLGERWYTADDDPVALLRAESKLKVPWILKTLSLNKSDTGAPRRILDIGCGAGFLSNALAAQDPRLEVEGIDLSADSLSVARSRDSTRRVKYAQMDASALQFADHSFDVVCAMDFLEHVDEPGRVIGEIARILRPGGMFFFHTFNRNWLSTLIVIKGVEWFVRNTPKDMHVSHLFIKPRELEDFCREFGLEVVELRGVAPKFFSLAFLRMLLTRKVPRAFRFVFTRSTLISYSGCAILTGPPKC
jgi:2-polyprenyl-6-hydroxyphenyl methylase/3-demethylubiquinone-9 3-methyltransferase